MYSEHIELLNFNGGALSIRALFILAQTRVNFFCPPPFHNSMALSGNNHLFGRRNVLCSRNPSFFFPCISNYFQSKELLHTTVEFLKLLMLSKILTDRNLRLFTHFTSKNRSIICNFIFDPFIKL